MCEPATATLLVATLVAAGGSVYSGIQQQKAAEASADTAEEAAAATREKAAYDEKMHREKMQKILSSQQAAYGTSGVTTEGSPLLVMEDTARQGELDALAIRYGGDVEAAQKRSAANLYRMQGNTAMTSGIIGAGSSLLSGATKYYDNKMYGTKLDALLGRRS